eukprot:1154028-Pelagomonas_calceolata.AAC.16
MVTAYRYAAGQAGRAAATRSTRKRQVPKPVVNAHATNFARGFAGGTGGVLVERPSGRMWAHKEGPPPACPCCKLLPPIWQGVVGCFDAPSEIRNGLNQWVGWKPAN